MERLVLPNKLSRSPEDWLFVLILSTIVPILDTVCKLLSSTASGFWLSAKVLMTALLQTSTEKDAPPLENSHSTKTEAGRRKLIDLLDYYDRMQDTDPSDQPKVDFDRLRLMLGLAVKPQ